MMTNYDKQVYMARDLFLNYDQEEMIRKFSLDADETWIRLRMLDRMYRVSRKSGVIEYQNEIKDTACGENQDVREDTACCEGQDMREDTVCGENQNMTEYVECCDYQIVMIIYDVLCYAKQKPVLAQQWCPVYGLQRTMSSPSADIFTKRYAEQFSGRCEQLRKACEKIGGKRPENRAGADVCWQFSVFSFLPVQFRFWDGDDEFQPKIQLLWDKNTLDYIHFETTYYVQGHLLERLAELL